MAESSTTRMRRPSTTWLEVTRHAQQCDQAEFDAQRAAGELPWSRPPDAGDARDHPSRARCALMRAAPAPASSGPLLDKLHFAGGNIWPEDGPRVRGNPYFPVRFGAYIESGAITPTRSSALARTWRAAAASLRRAAWSARSSVRMRSARSSLPASYQAWVARASSYA